MQDVEYDEGKHISYSADYGLTAPQAVRIQSHGREGQHRWPESGGAAGRGPW